ncbi:MAG TPA: FtsH protease activity modulator HflK [Thermotogaceae bacterium]|nr:FtsH protease activity modulator HflK [Thermotogaceae bacterium]
MTDFEFEINDQQEEKGGGFKRFLKLFSFLIIMIIIGVYFSTGIYQVGASEVALVKRFGKYIRQAGPGIHYHLPYPFESVVKVDIRTLRKIEIGFRTVSVEKMSYQEVKDEALMLTGDNNFALVEAIIQYRVKDPVKFAFSLISPYEVVKFVTESVLRERVAQRDIDAVLTSDRDLIAIESAQRIQKILDDYGVGILVENVKLQDVSPPDQVIAAFDDVNSARQDKEKLINEAMGYQNDAIPKAEGKAQEILNEAMAYKQERILKAQGDTIRFKKVYENYVSNREVTRKRFYIETMEQILPEIKKVVLTGDQNILQFLDLESILKGGETK